MKAYLGLGSNLGDRAANLRAALTALAEDGPVVVVSSLYETDAISRTPQPPYYNAACAIETDLDPAALLARLQAIERQLGRTEKHAHNEPRPIDLDILLYEDIMLARPELAIPHPLLEERAFVLVPLAEIAPDVHHPLLGRTIAELQREVGNDGVRLVEARGWER